jgi:HSP20 family protein
MRLTRWVPTRTGREMVNIHNEFDRVLEDFFGPSSLSKDLAPMFAPPADIHETPEEFVLKTDVPGVAPSDVKVSLTGDTLVIRGERKDEKTDGGTRHRVERVYGSFERTFQLGSRVRPDQIKAKYRDGVLEVHVPKAEEARVREIEVQTS